MYSADEIQRRTRNKRVRRQRRNAGHGENEKQDINKDRVDVLCEETDFLKDLKRKTADAVEKAMAGGYRNVVVLFDTTDAGRDAGDLTIHKAGVARDLYRFVAAGDLTVDIVFSIPTRGRDERNRAIGYCVLVPVAAILGRRHNNEEVTRYLFDRVIASFKKDGFEPMPTGNHIHGFDEDEPIAVFD